MTTRWTLLLACALLAGCPRKTTTDNDLAAVDQPVEAPEAPEVEGRPAPTVSKNVWQDLSLTALNGAPVDVAALQGKAAVVVNVASKCGFTPQYEGLQAMYEELKDQGFEIIGVPCNQFLGQEPGDAEQIASFCQENYGVSFQMLEKQKVNGPERSELYARLVGSEVGGGEDIGWNFEKFVIDRNGQVVARFASKVTPDDEAFRAAVQKAIGSTATP